MSIQRDAFLQVNTASRISEYNSDYLTQLCRKSVLYCKQISGVWFVSADDLRKHASLHSGKSLVFTADDLIYIRRSMNPVNDCIDINGREYISSDNASRISSYSRDYITQLARNGEIDAVKYGKVWFVNKKSLQDYKNPPVNEKVSKNTDKKEYSVQNEIVFEYEKVEPNSKFEDIPLMDKDKRSFVKIKKKDRFKTTVVDGGNTIHNNFNLKEAAGQESGDGIQKKGNNKDKIKKISDAFGARKKEERISKSHNNGKSLKDFDSIKHETHTYAVLEYDEKERKDIQSNSGLPGKSNERRQINKVRKNGNKNFGDLRVKYKSNKSENKAFYLSVIYFFLSASIFIVLYFNLIQFNILPAPERVLFSTESYPQLGIK